MRTTTTTAVPPDDGSHFLFFHIFVAIWADFCLTTSFHDGCMAFGFWQRMHRHANRCLTLRCPAFTNESFIVTYHWLWHVSMALLHYFIILSFLWSCVVGTHCFVRCLGHPLSSSSSWPSHVRNHPFLPCPGRHAYFLIERWLFETPFCSLQSDEDDREKTLQLDVPKLVRWATSHFHHVATAVVVSRYPLVTRRCQTRLSMPMLTRAYRGNHI